MRAADLPAIMAIAAASPEAPQWREADYGAYLEPGAASPLLRMVLVAEANGRMSGFAAASLVLDGTENRCELDTIAVAPSARRQGIGQGLLEAVLQWAAEHGARRMGLEVRPSNAAAVMLYRQMGFAEEARRPAYYHDPGEDALLLGRVVTPVSSSGSISTDKEVEGPASQC